MLHEQLKRVLDDHAAWLRGEGGSRANLSRANLSWADLRGANLREANLSGANLSGANLSGADLSRADLSGADLSGANLSEANLSGANLSGANLRGAGLSGADLSGAGLSGAGLSGADLSRAYLRWADLGRADLSEASLSGTCLDPANAPSGADGSFRKTSHGRVLGYRTQRSTHAGSAEYMPGESYTAPVFSTCDTDCHPGLYLWPTLEQAQEWAECYSADGIIKVSAKAVDVHSAGDKWRCKAFRVLGVEDNNAT